MRLIVLTALLTTALTVSAGPKKRNSLPTWGDVREAAIDTLLEDLQPAKMIREI